MESLLAQIGFTQNNMLLYHSSPPTANRITPWLVNPSLFFREIKHKTKNPQFVILKWGPLQNTFTTVSCHLVCISIKFEIICSNEPEKQWCDKKVRLSDLPYIWSSIFPGWEEQKEMCFCIWSNPSQVHPLPLPHIRLHWQLYTRWYSITHRQRKIRFNMILDMLTKHCQIWQKSG